MHAHARTYDPELWEEFCLFTQNFNLQTRNQYDQLLLERLGGAEFSLSNQAQFYFDSVWAAARALDLTSSKLTARGREDFVGWILLLWYYCYHTICGHK